MRYGRQLNFVFTVWLALVAMAAQAQPSNCTLDEAQFRAARAETGESKVRAFERLTEACPAFSGLYNLGVAYFEAGAYEKAIAAYLRARGRNDLDPTVLPEVNARIAESRHAAGQIGAAICALAQAEARAGTTPSELVQAVRDRIESDPRRDEVPVKELVESLHCMARAQIHVAFPERVEFEFNSDRLNERGRVQARRLGEMIFAYLKETVSETRARADLIGHADKRGSDAYNNDLTLRRARSVRDWIEKTLPGLAGRLVYEGRGKRELRDSGDSEAAHRANRRVEVRFE